MKLKEHTHKITRQLQDEIYLIASTLPPLAKADANGRPIYKQVVVPGTKVRKEDLKPGTPIMPDAMYRINELQYVNHALEMINLARRDGSMAIYVYQSDVMAQYKLFQAQSKKVNSPFNKLKSWIKKKLAR